MRFSEYRRQYKLSGLRRPDLRPDPVELFTQWQTQAIEAGLADPTACVLATGQTDAGLRQRMVLMKGVDDRGLVFYTNYQSGRRWRWQRANRLRCYSPGMNWIGKSV